jgi:hypothetical protein
VLLHLIRNLMLSCVGIAVGTALTGALSIPVNYYLDPEAFRFVWGGGSISPAALQAHRERVMLFILLGGLAGIASAQAADWRSRMGGRFDTQPA